MATTYLCVVRFTRAVTAEIILSLFQTIYGTHHAKVGSSETPWEVENLAAPIVLDSFMTDRGTHCLLPSFQAISKFHPIVDFCIQRWPDLVMIY